MNSKATATKCSRNWRGSNTHKCTGGPYCKGDCKPNFHRLTDAIKEALAQNEADFKTKG